MSLTISAANNNSSEVLIIPESSPKLPNCAVSALAKSYLDGVPAKICRLLKKASPLAVKLQEAISQSDLTKVEELCCSPLSPKDLQQALQLAVSLQKTKILCFLVEKYLPSMEEPESEDEIALDDE